MFSEACALIESALVSSPFKQGAVVQEVGEPIDKIYFPQNGMVSLVVLTKEGGGIEAATIGYEGAVGLHRGLGKRRAFTRAVIQLPGTLSYIAADAFEHAARQSAGIKEMIAKYTEVLLVEAQQIAACNAVHNAEARLARWLLQTQDRIPSKPAALALTQEFLSQMLGNITILDRKGLEEAACECYRIIRHETLPEVIEVDLKAGDVGRAS